MLRGETGDHIDKVPYGTVHKSSVFYLLLSGITALPQYIMTVTETLVLITGGKNTVIDHRVPILQTQMRNPGPYVLSLRTLESLPLAGSRESLVWRRLNYLLPALAGREPDTGCHSYLIVINKFYISS